MRWQEKGLCKPHNNHDIQSKMFKNNQHTNHTKKKTLEQLNYTPRKQKNKSHDLVLIMLGGIKKSCKALGSNLILNLN